MNRLLFVSNKSIILKYCSLSFNIVALLVTATMFLFSCQAKVATDIPPGLLENNAVPILEATDFEVYYTDSGVVRYHMKTPKLLDFSNDKNPYRDFPEGFLLQKYDQNKMIISELSGNKGKEYIDDKKWIATGNVILINNSGDTLKTEELIYLQKEDMIYSDKFVSIKKGDQYITGSGGFKSDTQMTKWAFVKTKGHIYVKEDF